MQMYLLCLQPSVRKELGVGDRLWEACDMQVHAGEPEWRVMCCVLRTVRSGVFSCRHDGRLDEEI